MGKKVMPSRMSQLDWLDLGLTQLKHQGATAMTIEALCACAGRTKGSFYAHFSDFNSYVAQVTQHWRALQTERVIEALPSDAEAAIRRLDEIVQELDWDLEHHMRLWAHTNPHVLHEVVAVDQRRVAFLVQLNERLGLPPAAARTKGLLSYFALIGHITLSAAWPELKAGAREYSEALHRALLAAQNPSETP